MYKKWPSKPSVLSRVYPGHLFCFIRSSNMSEHLLVNLGFPIFIFPDFRFVEHSFETIWFLNIEENNKGVLGRPWTKRKVLKAISSTIKFQFTVNPES